VREEDREAFRTPHDSGRLSHKDAVNLIEIEELPLSDPTGRGLLQAAVELTE
jgi:hypothetical protein